MFQAGALVEAKAFHGGRSARNHLLLAAVPQRRLLLAAKALVFATAAVATGFVLIGRRDA